MLSLQGYSMYMSVRVAMRVPRGVSVSHTNECPPGSVPAPHGIRLFGSRVARPSTGSMLVTQLRRRLSGAQTLVRAFSSRAISGQPRDSPQDSSSHRGGPPGEGDKLHVLFPRRGAYQVSMEVKKRILYSTPHMGGQKLKKLARLHARKGTMDSFVADLESRLDRFLLRCNLVRSDSYPAQLVHDILAQV